MTDNTYMKNYQTMIKNDNHINTNNIIQSNSSIGIDGKIYKKDIKFSQKLYLKIKNEYPSITQYDIDKIFFDNNLSPNESKWQKIDMDLFVRAIKKKIGISVKDKDIIEENKEIQRINPISTRIEEDNNSNFILLSINSNWRDPELNPNPNNYRILFTKSGPKYSQSKYINKILIDVSCVEIQHIIVPKLDSINKEPYILLNIKELGSNLVGEESFAKLMFNNQNDNFMEFSSNNREIYKKTFKPSIILDQFNISFLLPNGDNIDMNNIDHTITFKIWCKEQNI